MTVERYTSILVADIPLHGIQADDKPYACEARLPIEDTHFDLRCPECRTAAAGYLDVGFDPLLNWRATRDGLVVEIVELSLSDALQVGQLLQNEPGF